MCTTVPSSQEGYVFMIIKKSLACFFLSTMKFLRSISSRARLLKTLPMYLIKTTRISFWFISTIAAVDRVGRIIHPRRSPRSISFSWKKIPRTPGRGLILRVLVPSGNLEACMYQSVQCMITGVSFWMELTTTTATLIVQTYCHFVSKDINSQFHLRRHALEICLYQQKGGGWEKNVCNFQGSRFRWCASEHVLS